MDKTEKKKEIKCNKCQKIFFNEGELTIHNNLKHGENIFKRGRPKKNPQYFKNPEKEIEYIQFFLDEKRKKTSSQILSKEEICSIIFQTIKSLYYFQEEIQYKIKLLENNFNSKLVLNCIYQKEMRIPLKQRNIDDVLYEFFLYSENFVNKEYLSLIFKFIIFFQDFLNLKFAKKFNLIDYTSIYLPKDIPLYIEEFILNYLSLYHNMKKEEKNEYSALAFYFCNWLTKNEYTNYLLIKNKNYN